MDRIGTTLHVHILMKFISRLLQMGNRVIQESFNFKHMVDHIQAWSLPYGLAVIEIWNGLTRINMRERSSKIDLILHFTCVTHFY